MAKQSTMTPPPRQTRVAALSVILFVAVFAGCARAEECFCLLHVATGAAGWATLSSAAQDAKPPSLGNLGAAAVFVVGLVSTWLYATGWTYAYHYLNRFGVPLLMVDISKEHYFVYGWVVLRHFAVSGLLIAGAGVLLFAT